MKKVTLFLISLSFLWASFIQAQIRSFSYTEDTDAHKANQVPFIATPRLAISQPNDFIVCDDLDGNIDGITEFDLSSIDDEVSTELNVSISYHASQADANNRLSSIIDVETYPSAGETIYVRAEDTLTGDYETTSFNLVVHLVPIASFDSKFSYEVDPNSNNPVEIGLKPSNFTAEQVRIDWYLDDVLITGESDLILPSVRSQGTYKAIITFISSGCQSEPLNVTVAELQSSVFPQGISPEVSPGVNDTFDLSGFDVTRLEIFNRHGILVYSKINYTNEWFGQTNSGEELPVGTYFYSVEYEGGTKKRGAWVYLNR